ncbi:MAG: hypothetical protein JWO94_256 [Verrucomicrobiaceae bacterium]|nr:hypothetical protein [Verrucomicrobiaceae bacterium]
MGKAVSTQVIHRGGQDSASTKDLRTGKSSGSSSSRRASNGGRSVDAGSDSQRASTSASTSGQIEEGLNDETQVTAAHTTVASTTGGGTTTRAKISEGFSFVLKFTFQIGTGGRGIRASA